MQVFRVKIVGVTFANDDGRSRQEIIQRMQIDERVQFVREPQSEFDKYAIAVLTCSGAKVGYLPAGDCRLASHMDMGGLVSAQVVAITGGPNILERFFNRASERPYGCVVEVIKHEFDWPRVRPYMDRSKAIEDLIQFTRGIESGDPQQAIANYREAIAGIQRMDGEGSICAAWRRARYPINRLSMLLEKSGDLPGALDVILSYEALVDCFGITAQDMRSVAARKERLLRQLKR